MRMVFFATLSGLLLACAAPGSSPAPAPVNDPAAACRARGGDFIPICRLQLRSCVISYRDAGKACRGDADCQGKCLAVEGVAQGAPVKGRCQANSNPCGCNTPVENGRAGPTLCVD